MTRIDAVDVLTVRLPFRFSFGHALAARSESTNVVVRVRLAGGAVGYGEGVPRDYVTGETVDGALAALEERLVPVVLGRELEGPDDAAAVLEVVPYAGDAGLDTAARCALELAVLDAVGHHFGVPIAHWLGRRTDTVVYDGVLPFSSPKKLVPLGLLARGLRVRHIKVKVGGADLDKELRSIATLRRMLGRGADLRVDANCGWGVDQALAALERMRAYRISAVEQPVAGEDLEGLRRITAEAPEAVIVDESLRTEDEAKRLVAERACNAFNIRVSKCGGLLPSLRLAQIADQAGLFCVVGAQVGESGILSAAGRHLAAAIAPRYVEGSGGRLLLKADLTRESVLPGIGGRGRVFSGPGLGVHVRDDLLDTLGEIRGTYRAQAVSA